MENSGEEPGEKQKHSRPCQAHTAATLEARELCHCPLRKPLLQRLLTAFDK